CCLSFLRLPQIYRLGYCLCLGLDPNVASGRYRAPVFGGMHADIDVEFVAAMAESAENLAHEADRCGGRGGDNAVVAHGMRDIAIMRGAAIAAGLEVAGAVAGMGPGVEQPSPGEGKGAIA